MSSWKRRGRLLPASLLVVLAVSSGIFAQSPANKEVTAQTHDDEEFSHRMKEWTTKPEFISPLVDHLPKSSTVPNPKEVLGHYIGEPKKLTYYAVILTYYRALATKSPRVKVLPIGKSDEGRELVVVFVGSDESI